MDHGLVGGEVGPEEQAAARSGPAVDRLGDLALVEGGRSAARQHPKRPPEVALDEPVRLRERAAGRQRDSARSEDGERLGNLGHRPQTRRDPEREGPRDVEAALGEPDRRRQHVRQRQRAEGPEGEIEAGDEARCCGRGRAVHVRVVADLAPPEPGRPDAVEQLEGAGRGAWRRHREIDGDRRGSTRPVEQQHAAPTETAGRRLDHRERERGGDRGIHGVAAAAEDRDADVRREPVLRGHGAVRDVRGVLLDSPAGSAGDGHHVRSRIRSWCMAARPASST